MKGQDLDNGWQQAADELFARIASILDTARGQIVQTVNHVTVVAYWHIGREVVEALQQGEKRAAYGKNVIERSAQRLTERYGRGFSATNLGYFRQFYLAYRNRIPHTLCGELPQSQAPAQIPHTASGESPSAFQSNLSWSHYRALMRVSDTDARQFYETEAARANWAVRDLERQINSLYYQRLLASTDKNGMLQSQRQPEQALRPVDVLKDPYVLEFLDIPSTPRLHESELEEGIIARLQQFLLELGRGFSFVARQQRIRFNDKDFYVDLVFYNYLLKCFVLVDLKIG